MTATEQAPGRELVHPTTGEILDLAAATTTDLAVVHGRVGDLMRQLADFRQHVVDEVAARMDRENARSAVVGGLKIETNAPTTDTYPVEALLDALTELVGADVLSPAVVERVIETPLPKEPEPVVRKAELNRLRAHNNPVVVAKLDAVRVRNPQRRTLKIQEVRS